MLQTTTLQTDKGDAAIVVGDHAKSPFVIVCEHAGQAIPEALGDLGLSATELQSHIAWDPGAAQLAEFLAKKLDATLIKQRYSRLVYDCNRPPSSKDAMRTLSENTKIPGNDNISDEEKHWRTKHIYQAFHRAVSEQLNQRSNPVMITIHSFTPVYGGQHRAVDIGILHDQDSRLADAMLSQKYFDDGILVRRNEPYGPQDGVTHTLNKHGQERQILNVMIEIKNTLIADNQSQRHYADQLAKTITQAVNKIKPAD